LLYTLDQVTLDQVTLDQETLDQVTLDQETLDQETLDQVTLDQVTLDQVTLDQVILDQVTLPVMHPLGIGMSQNNDHKTRGTYPTSVHKITWIVIKYFFFKRGARATNCVFTWFLATGIKQNTTAVWTLPCIKLLGTIRKVWRQKKLYQ
jgi:uncharacterized protein YjbI with pentapeptide repeats